MNSYADFAYIYDKLMRGDVDYERWADYIENIFSRYGKNPSLVCDLACGTGNITIPLARRGYDMTGIDVSGDMLNAARKKAGELDILFLNQNMASLDLYGTMDAFTCMIDGINYIISPKSLLDMLIKIKTCFLEPGGIVIFDISTRHKLKNVIGSETFIHSERDIFYAWRNKYIEGRDLSDMLLTFFVREKRGGYRRFEERHLQRAYTERQIRSVLKRAGFEHTDVYDELTFEPPRADSERIVFVCS